MRVICAISSWKSGDDARLQVDRLHAMPPIYVNQIPSIFSITPVSRSITRTRLCTWSAR